MFGDSLSVVVPENMQEINEVQGEDHIGME